MSLSGLTPDAQKRYNDELREVKLTPFMQKLITQSLAVIRNDKARKILTVKAKGSEKEFDMTYEAFTEYLRLVPPLNL
jgi:hypothetical protein